MPVNTMSTVREWAVTVPGATRVFEQMGIDYCCGGGRTLADACRQFHAPVEEVLRRLEAATGEDAPRDNAPDLQTASLTALAAHIVETHHVFTRAEFVRLERLLDKVCSRHGGNHPELGRLREMFLGLKQDLLPHMLKEEQVLFTYITRLEDAVGAGRDVQTPFFVTVQNPVRMMMMEHDAAGELLREMRQVTNDYNLPPDACISYQTLYQAFAGLETDLHRHIHLENNILFPRAVEMESQAQSEWQSRAGEHQCFKH